MHAPNPNTQEDTWMHNTPPKDTDDDRDRGGDFADFFIRLHDLLNPGLQNQTQRLSSHSVAGAEKRKTHERSVMRDVNTSTCLAPESVRISAVLTGSAEGCFHTRTRY